VDKCKKPLREEPMKSRRRQLAYRAGYHKGLSDDTIQKWVEKVCQTEEAARAKGEVPADTPAPTGWSFVENCECQWCVAWADGKRLPYCAYTQRSLRQKTQSPGEAGGRRPISTLSKPQQFKAKKSEQYLAKKAHHVGVEVEGGENPCVASCQEVPEEEDEGAQRS
jgi:hypothetical protein